MVCECNPVSIMARILIIDDDPDICRLLQRCLDRGGYDCCTIANGKMALRMMEDIPMDLVVTDLIMPEQEGLETILKIRDAYPGTKILAISGGGKGPAETYLKIAGKMGADEVLRKPFPPRRFLKLVEKLTLTSR